MTDTVTDPVTVTPEDMRANALESLGSSISGAYTASVTEIGAIARIARGIIALVDTGNGGPVTLKCGKADTLELDAFTLAAYASGVLPRERGDLPRAADVLNALQLLSPAIGSAQIALAKASDALPKMKKSERAAQSAEVDRLTRALNTVKQPIRRGAKLAAYVLDMRDGDTGVPYYDAASVRTEDGVLYATPAPTDAEGKRMPEEDISFKLAEEYFAKPKAPAGAASGSTTADVVTIAAPKTAVVSDDKLNALGVTFRNEGMRRGATDRPAFADAVNAFAGMVSDLEGGPADENERKALARLWATIGDMLSDAALVDAVSVQDMVGEREPATDTGK